MSFAFYNIIENENYRSSKFSGIFLACWVPFFSVYIVNAICTKMNVESCQVGFSAFFYTTWLGYVNSCVNPIIYTIFNIEFRRAFKSLLLGKGRKNNLIRKKFSVIT